MGWENQHSPKVISVCQQRYGDELLPKYVLRYCNSTLLLMVTGADIGPAAHYELKLDQNRHSLYMRQVAELLYLAFCTRSNIPSPFEP